MKDPKPLRGEQTGRGYDKALGECRAGKVLGAVSGSKTLAEVGVVGLGRGGERGRTDHGAWHSAVQALVAPGAKEGVTGGRGDALLTHTKGSLVATRRANNVPV